MPVEHAQGSYTHGGSARPLLGETIGANLGRTGATFSEAEALVEFATGRRWTYLQFEHDVDALAAGLMDLGVAKGDRVGIWSPNNAEWVLTQYATARIGAVLVNINPAYRVHELGYVLRQSACKLVIAAPSFKTSDYKAMLDAVRTDVPDLEAVVYLGSAEWDGLMRAATDELAKALETRSSELSFDDPINIQYTSGTTGFPKGATLSHHNILNNGYFVGELCGYSARDRVCIPVPFYHCFGMVLGNLAATTHGACIVIPAPAFDAESHFKLLRKSSAHPFTAYRPCSSPSWRSRTSPPTTCRRSEPGSWPALPVPSR